MDDQDLPINLDFSESRQRSGSWETSSSKTFGFSQSISVSAELPGLPVGIESTTLFSWEESSSKTNTESWSEARDMGWKTGEVVVKPGKAVVYRVYAIKGAIKGEIKDAKYGATVSQHIFLSCHIYLSRYGTLMLGDGWKFTLMMGARFCSKLLVE